MRMAGILQYRKVGNLRQENHLVCWLAQSESAASVTPSPHPAAASRCSQHQLLKPKQISASCRATTILHADQWQSRVGACCAVLCCAGAMLACSSCTALRLTTQDTHLQCSRLCSSSSSRKEAGEATKHLACWGKGSHRVAQQAPVPSGQPSVLASGWLPPPPFFGAGRQPPPSTCACGT